jgi:hypothetical protein
MIQITKTLTLRAVMCAILVLGAASPSMAQAFLSSVESVIGPIFPGSGVTSTFRSELGTGLSVMALNRSQLSGNALNLLVGVSEVGLEKWANLNESPLLFDVYAKVRFWRLGARGQWGQFEEKSLSPDLGRFDFTGIRIGADFDVIQHRWLTFGASADYYFSDPEFRGFIRQPINANIRANIDLRGQRPTTVGAYARYIPPEILNIPVHAEFYYNTPLLGSPLTSYGASLVFRPQIYRFDVALRALIEKIYLKINQEIPVAVGPIIVNPSAPLNLEMEWSRYGAELAVYF